jgi:hypothetical protein
MFERYLHLFNGLVLGRVNVSYFRCISCGYIQTEEPYWLEEAYSFIIADLDVGLVSRNLKSANVVEKILLNHFIPQDQFLDYGGGYGLFVRLMRDRGFNFFRQDKGCQNLFAKGFDITDIPEISNFSMVTAFEVFEHLLSPCNEASKLLALSDTLLISTEIVPHTPITALDDWWYFAPETGQHIGFFTISSLEYLAQVNGCNLYSNGKNLHLLSRRKFIRNPFDCLAPNQGLRSFFVKKPMHSRPASLIEHDFKLIRSRFRPNHNA